MVQLLSIFCLNVKTPTSTLIYPILMWLIGVSFAVLQFVSQLSMAHMALPLMQHFDLNAVQISYFSSSFFYTFLLMQLPAGLLFDKFGPKPVLIMAMLFFTVGSLVFAKSHTLQFAVFGRMMMGFGSAFGFIGMLCIASIWFDEKYFGFMVGLGEMIVMFVLAGMQFVMPACIEALGWQKLILSLSLCGLGILTLNIVFLRNNGCKKSTPLKQFLLSIKQTLCNKPAWINGIACGLLCTLLTVFCSLWGVPYLLTAHQFTSSQIGMAMAAIMIGIGVGAPCISYLATHHFKYKTVLLVTIFLTSVCFALILFLPSISPVLLYGLFFLLGIVCSSYVLFFAIAKGFCQQANLNTMMGFVNLMCMSGAILIQPLVGYALDYAHRPWLEQGIVAYLKQDFIFALSILLVGYVLSFIFVFLFKENAQQTITDFSDAHRPIPTNSRTSENINISI